MKPIKMWADNDGEIYRNKGDAFSEEIKLLSVLVIPLDAESVAELLHKIREAIARNIDCGPDSELLQVAASIAVAEAIGITAKRPIAKKGKKL